MENILKLSEKVIKNSIKFLISSTINSAHHSSIEDKDQLINMQLNMLVNMLQPEYALILTEELVRYGGNKEVWKEIEKKEIIEQIVREMKFVR